MKTPIKQIMVSREIESISVVAKIDEETKELKFYATINNRVFVDGQKIWHVEYLQADDYDEIDTKISKYIHSLNFHGQCENQATI